MTARDFDATLLKFRQNCCFRLLPVLILIAFSTSGPTTAPTRPTCAPVGTHWDDAPAVRLARCRRFFSATAVAVLLSFPAPAVRADEAPQRQSWTVGTGKTVVLAEYYEIQEADCRAMRAPPVIIKTRPTLGKLVVNTTTGQAGKSAKCRHVQVPVTRVLYHAGLEPGRDSFAWEIFFQARELGTRTVQGSATLTHQPSDR